jgi:hypothetical protein
MNRNRPNPDTGAPTTKPLKPRGNFGAFWVIILLLIAVACVWGVWKKSHQPGQPAESGPDSTQIASRQKNPSSAPLKAEEQALEPVEVSSTRTRPASNPGAVLVIPERKAISTQPTTPRPEPAPYTRQLVAGLTQIDLKAGKMTPEQAGQWKQGLQQVIQQGAAAVPAIREFLERNQDLSFDGVKDGNLAGYPSVRAGLLDALQQIGGPEALELSLQTMRTTADPLEIALLARNLEQQAPGQYRQEALNAARETLSQAAQDKLTGRDVAPLFQLLQTYGDANLLAELQKSLPRWNYYATMALAGLPEGQGIPALVREAQDPSTGTGARTVALQMLAQGAAHYPEAATALIEQARLNQIPDSAWRQIGWVLGGDQYQFGSQFFDSTLATPSGAGVRTYHIEAGNQNFYTTPTLSSLSAEQVNQRRALIDQLLGVTSNPTAVQGLQRARALLSGGQAQR